MCSVHFDPAAPKADPKKKSRKKKATLSTGAGAGKAGGQPPGGSRRKSPGAARKSHGKKPAGKDKASAKTPVKLDVTGEIVDAENQAAVSIQAIWRGRQARLQVRHLPVGFGRAVSQLHSANSWKASEGLSAAQCQQLEGL